MKNKNKKKKIKFLKIPMKFNPGKQKYEPNLPLTKKGEKPKIKINWHLMSLIIILLLITLTIIIFPEKILNLFGIK